MLLEQRSLENLEKKETKLEQVAIKRAGVHMWDYYCYYYYLLSSVELWLFLCQHSSYQSQSYQITRFQQENSPGTQKSRTLFRILAVSNSIGFCSRPFLIPIPSISIRCPKFLVIFPRAPYDKRYSCTSLHLFIHVFYTPHSSIFSLQIILLPPGIMQ